MIAAFIPVLPGLEDKLQWGVELSHFEYVVMMRRPKESATGSGLLAPFEIEVKILILIYLKKKLENVEKFSANARKFPREFYQNFKYITGKVRKF